MANFSIRNVDDTVAALLRKRAERHGVSLEAEVRQILREAVTTPTDLAALAGELFGPDNGVELAIPEHPVSEPPDFS